MSDVINYLLTFDKDKAQAREIAKGSALKLESNQLPLINLVQSLREYINDEDATIRSKAVTYLSQVITTLSPRFLTRQQTLVLCQFLCDRMEDGGAVMGLLALQNHTRYNKEMATMTFRAMLASFQDLQSRPQAQRYEILELLNDLMMNYREAIKTLGSESFLGIIDLVNGEKDPRDLMIIFSILEVCIVEWDIGEHAEALFDAVFCYFPITFRPPPDDPYGITAQDLKSRLRQCIAASSQFATYAFSQLLEKLDSSSSNVKLDVLQTITACVIAYVPSTISNYSVTLWDSLKYELFNVQEEYIAKEALSAIHAIAKQLDNDNDSVLVTTPLTEYLNPIITECKDRLLEPHHKQAKSASQILSVLAQDSLKALHVIVAEIMPSLLTLYQDANLIEERRAILEPLSQILVSARTCFTPVVVSGTVNNNPLYSFKDRLFEIFSQALMGTMDEEISFQVLASKCLQFLCTIRNLLTTDEVGMVVQYFDETIITEMVHARQELKDAAIEGLVEISRFNAAPLLNITFPAFMARLSTSATSTNGDCVNILESLARVSVERQLATTLIRRLFRYLDDVLYTCASSELSHSILATLHYLISQKGHSIEFDLEDHLDRIIGLLNRAATGVSQPTVLTQINVLDSLGRLTCLIVREAGLDKQIMVGQQVYTLFTEKPVFITVPSQVNLPEVQRNSIILSTYLLAAIRSDIAVPYLPGNLRGLLDDLIRLLDNESSAPIRRSLLQHIALLSNKFTLPHQLPIIMDILENPSFGLLNESKLSRTSLRIIFWLCKGLIMRSSAIDHIIKHLIKLLANSKYGTEAAHGFVILLAPDNILTRENGATMRFLAPQQVFSLSVPAIGKRFYSAESFVKSNYLVALSGIIKYVDNRVMLSNISALLPMLLQSLDLKDQDVKAATIETLTVVCQESPEVLEEHIPSLINRLVTAAADLQTNDPVVRYNALRCLRQFPGKIKETSLLPYRKAMARSILSALDDPKRDVRKEAVDCQTSWLRLDDPGEDD